MLGVRKLGGRQACGTYTESLRVALLATRILTVLVSLWLGVMMLTTALGHHPVLSRLLDALNSSHSTSTWHAPGGEDGVTVTVCKVVIAAWAFFTCATSLFSATLGASFNRQERPCASTDCGGPYAFSYTSNYFMGCGWVLITLALYCSYKLQWPAAAFEQAHFLLSASVCALLTLSAVLVDALKDATMDVLATQQAIMSV